jgi:hypothetical protein
MDNRADPDCRDKANRNRQLAGGRSALLRSNHAVSQIWPCEVCLVSDFAVTSAIMGVPAITMQKRQIAFCPFSVTTRQDESTGSWLPVLGHA